MRLWRWQRRYRLHYTQMTLLIKRCTRLLPLYMFINGDNGLRFIHSTSAQPQRRPGSQWANIAKCTCQGYLLKCVNNSVRAGAVRAGPADAKRADDPSTDGCLQISDVATQRVRGQHPTSASDLRTHTQHTRHVRRLHSHRTLVSHTRRIAQKHREKSIFFYG